MPETFPTAEYRLVQEREIYSAADALFVGIGGLVPQGKIWTLIGVMYMPSAAETRTISFSKVTVGGSEFAITNPYSAALNPARATPLEVMPMLDLLPGEYLRVRRDVATAGSTMWLKIQFIEWDLPLYDYIEPQITARMKRAGTSIAARVFRAGGGGSVSGGGGAPSRGSRGPLLK